MDGSPVAISKATAQMGLPLPLVGSAAALVAAISVSGAPAIDRFDRWLLAALSMPRAQMGLHQPLTSLADALVAAISMSGPQPVLQQAS